MARQGPHHIASFSETVGFTAFDGEADQGWLEVLGDRETREILGVHVLIHPALPEVAQRAVCRPAGIGRHPGPPGATLWNMSIATVAALVFAASATGVVAFQLALASGAPWGAYAMGGAYPGRFPARLRVAAVVQAVVIGALAMAILSRAGLVLPDLATSLPWLPWVAVAVSAVAVGLNAASRSAGERRIWVPIAVVMLVSSLAVVVGT